MRLLLLIVLSCVLSCDVIFGIHTTKQVTGDASSTHDGPESYAVRGVAVGVLEPVVLALEVENGSESLSVVRDGPFVFEQKLATGVAFSVTTTNPTCQLSKEQGVIADDDLELQLACGGAAILSQLELTGSTASSFELAFDKFGYTARLSSLQSTTLVTATAAVAGSVITIDDGETQYDVASRVLPLAPGVNASYISVINPASGLRNEYNIVIERTGAIEQVSYIKSPKIDASDWFGYQVSLSSSGDILAVGVPLEDSSTTDVGGDNGDNSIENSGAVYIFARSDDGSWKTQAYLKASDTDIGDNFGYSISLSAIGDVLVVGAPFEDSDQSGINPEYSNNDAPDSGAVYVFERLVAGREARWVRRDVIKASNVGVGDGFGTSVALSGSGNLLAVGAFGESSNTTGIDSASNDSATQSGAVYIFARNASGESWAWTQDVFVKASNTDANDRFGYSVALSSNGDTLAVGAVWEGSGAVGIDGDQSSNSEVRSGAVYIFERAGNVGDEGWTQQAYIKASNSNANDWFGHSVALSDDGDTLAVGAVGEASSATGVDGDESDNMLNDSGAAYVFRRAQSDGLWTQQTYIKAANSGADDLFGASLALCGNGDTLAIGAPNEGGSAVGVDGDANNDGMPNSGALYLFKRVDLSDNSPWSEHAYIKPANTGEFDLFGTSVALSTSCDTLVVGAYNEDSAASGVNGDDANDDAMNSGATYVFH